MQWKQWTFHHYFVLEKWNNITRIFVNKNYIKNKHCNKRHFNRMNSLPVDIKEKSEKLKIRNYNEINDENFKEVLNKERTFLLFGYASYSHNYTSLLQIITKVEKELKKQLQLENTKIPLVYKFNIYKNYELIKKFHIKTIPIIQLRHEKKLVEEISGKEVQEQNIKNIMYRFLSYFNSIEFVNRLDDFLRRDAELLQRDEKEEEKEKEKEKEIESKKKIETETETETETYKKIKVENEKQKENEDVVTSSAIVTSAVISEIQNGLEKKIENKKKEITKHVLNNLQLKYQCKTYSVFKQLELAMKEWKIDEMKTLLNEILINHDTYLDINIEYSKLVAKAFVYLFDENKISLDKVMKLKDSFLLTNKIDVDISKVITFNEPVLLFDNFKNKSLQKITTLDQYLSQENDLLINGFVENDFPENSIIDIQKKENELRAKYLSRLFRILAVKYFTINDFENCLKNALESYKITFPLKKNREHNKSKVLIENIFLYLGAYNENVQKFRSQLEFLYTDKNFRVVRFPHTRAIRGGRPIMKRGKSGKWRWLSHDWKPRWVKKKTKLVLEEEWRVVTDKNVPFWN